MENVVEEHLYITNIRRSCLSFFAELICYALLLCYTSKQAYKLLLKKFPLPSFSSLLEKIKTGDVESIPDAKLLLLKGHLTQDCVLMVDEMYLQKGT